MGDSGAHHSSTRIAGGTTILPAGRWRSAAAYQCGRVVGAKRRNRIERHQPRHQHGDIFATIYKAFGIDWTKEYDTPIGRPSDRQLVRRRHSRTDSGTIVVDGAARSLGRGGVWVRSGADRYLWVCYTLNHADRQVVYTLFPALQKTWLERRRRWIDGRLFLWVYGLCSPAAGILAIAFPKPGSLRVAWRSGAPFTVLSGFSPNGVFSPGLRGLLGVSESCSCRRLML